MNCLMLSIVFFNYSALALALALVLALASALAWVLGLGLGLALVSTRQFWISDVLDCLFLIIQP